MFDGLHFLEMESYGTWGKGVLMWGERNMGIRYWWKDCREAGMNISAADEAIVYLEEDQVYIILDAGDIG